MHVEQSVSPQMMRRVVAASVVGNAFEWFDFAIYGIFAVTIAKLFFPADNPAASLLLTLATFGVGFAVRPIGGVLLGMYGDRVGRKKALSVTILLMAIGTGVIGFLPTYAAIGIAAPILMVLARLIQGVSAGGEFSGATTMLVEFSPPHRRGFFGSFQMSTQALAFSFGALVAYLLTRNLDPQQMDTWGWRLPFIFGILVGPVGWLIRSRVDESPEFLAYLRARSGNHQKPAKVSLSHLLRNYPRELAASIAVCIVGTVSAYIFIFFVPIFAKSKLGISATDANLATFIGTAVILLLCPLAGHLSDRWGRRAVVLPAILVYGFVAFFLLRNLIDAPSFGSLLLLQIGVSAVMSFFWGPMPIILTEVFPVEMRSTGSAFTYNMAVLLFGGLAPFINTWLVQATGSNFAPIYYVEFSVLLGVLGMLLLPGMPSVGRVAMRA